MIKKILKILQKAFFLMYSDGFFLTFKTFHQYYINGGRKGLTKGINIRYKLSLKKNKVVLYNKWIETFEKKNIIRESHTFDYEPLISIIISTENSETIWLKKAIDSVLSQTYENWELCIVDNASTENSTIEELKNYEKKYKNIKVVFFPKPEVHSEVLNRGLSLSLGEYITFLGESDVLSPIAFYEIVNLLNQDSNIKLIYTDEDEIDENSNRSNPHFKTDWNPDMFFSKNYIENLFLIKKEIIYKSEKFREEYLGAENYDLLLQCLKFISDNEIYHIPQILYHKRVLKKSNKEYRTSGIEALEEYFHKEVGIHIEEGLLPNTYKVSYPILDNPLVSIVIPTKDNHELLFTCISSILEKTDYLNYEIIIIDNQTTQVDALSYLERLKLNKKIKVFSYDFTFNYASINNFAVKKASGKFLLFLNNDIEILHESWLKEMLQHANRNEIGVVGAKLYYADMTIQHAGVVLGIGGVAGHVHKSFSKTDNGYMSRLQIVQNYSAVTGACMLIEKSIFDEVGGFEERLSVAFNDVDLCLKVLSAGYRNLWTPYAELIHYESKSRGLENSIEKQKRFNKEIDFMQKKWKKELLSDKCYNKNLTLENENFSLKIEEKIEKNKKWIYLSGTFGCNYDYCFIGINGSTQSFC